jgi:hypothetical protein
MFVCVAVVNVPAKFALAVILPVILISPVPVTSFEFKSKSPPNCGVVSETTGDRLAFVIFFNEVVEVS